MKQIVLAIGGGLLMALPAAASPEFKSNEKFSGNKWWQQTQRVSGVVTNEAGEPLSNVTVQAKGTSKTTITATDGSFSLELPSGAKTLVFSYVGMETQELPVDQRTSYRIKLSAAANTLNDVVVVGYGTQRRINLTGSVSTVSGGTLTQRPAPNAANLLEGRVSGLQVTQPSSEPGRDNPNLLIRGRATFGGSTGPLVLIDGVTGSINNLSPDDIENISVLKDAASAAIYGSRAANGVILVTTKKGRKGQTTVSYRVNVGVYTPTAMPDFITNSAEYMTLYNAAAARSGVAFRYDSAEIAKYKNATDQNAYPNFDYVDYYFKSAVVSNHNISLSGGNERNTFNLSLSYLNQDAMLPGYSFKKYNGLFNYTSQINDRITIGTSMNLTYKDRQEPPFTSENFALAVYAAGPLYGPFLPDGSGRIVSRAYQAEGRNRNPQEMLAMGWQNTKEYNLNGQAYIDIKILKGLTWTSKVALNYVDEYYKMYQHPYSAYLLQQKDPATGDYQTGSSAFFGPDYLGVTDQYSKTITPTIYSVANYETKIAKDHDVKALVGFEQVYSKFQTLRARRLNGVSTALTELAGYTNTGEAINATYPRLPGLSAPYEWALQSFFGRVNYAYKNKYLLEANLRYDGTSRVSPDYRWGVFPSVSGAWLVSQEDFFNKNVTFLNNLKLRASYGTLGNQEIGNYAYQNVITVSGVSYPFGNTTPAQAAVLNSYKDQSLQWETTRIADFGLDLDLRRGLFGLTFDWFKKTTSDILASQPVPASLGLSSPTFNNGKMESRGIELELRHQNQIGAFHYGVNAQISTANNKVLDIKVPSIGTSINQVGLPYGSHYLYVWDGIFQVEDTAAGKVPKHVLNPNPKPGDLKMKDMNGDGVVDANDRMVVKGAYPDYIYSFGFNADYKGFGISAFFQGVQGLKNRVNNWGVDPFMQGTAPTTKWRDAWTPQNRSNTLPGIYVAGYTGVAAYAGSTYYLMDASYLRLKNVVLSYTFPRAIFSKIKARDLSIYVSGENLFTITKYEGSDPERSSTTGNYVQYPQARVLNVGLNVKF
ncbi:SusC/RagA family TonB-linked outer membrane protein [Flavisolibacter ginsenosidimutans]|nr:TonB-dependent receptor [Flavisolibacter ginsenosidimutans]